MKVPLSPKELGLPFESWRPHQQETVSEIINSPDQVILLNAPPGIGKTNIAAAVCKLTTNKSLIAVFTHQLMEQYLRDVPWLTKLGGKDQYNCILPNLEAVPVSQAPCQTGWDCSKRSVCTFFVDQRQAHTSKTVITTYAKLSTRYMSNINTLVCDEGHLLENYVLAMGSIRIVYKDFENAGFTVPAFGSIGEASNWALSKLSTVEREKDNLRQILNKSDDYKATTSVRERYLMLNKLNNPLTSLSHADESALWSIEPYRKVMYIRPIWASDHARKIFLGTDVLPRKKLVIQSGTLDGARVAKILGVDKYKFISLPHQFPKERRPIYYSPIVKMGMKSSEEDLHKMIAAVDKVIDRYPGQKGIIHTVNWTLTEQVGSLSKYKNRLILQPRGKKRSLGIDAWLQTSDSILVSPSVTTGLDGKFDKARFQIMIKLPFEDQSERAVAERLEEDADWYAYQCAFHLQQMSGRVMRDVWDYGETWILDSHFGWFYRNNKHLFNSWFIEAVQEVSLSI